MPEPEARISLRLPPSLKERVEAHALASRRSINAAVVVILEDALRREAPST